MHVLALSERADKVSFTPHRLSRFSGLDCRRCGGRDEKSPEVNDFVVVGL